MSRLADKLGISASSRIDRHLVGSRVEQRPNVIKGSDPTANGQRHENHLGRTANHVEHDLAFFVAGRNVEEHEFVGSLLLIARSHLDGITRIAKVQKIRPLNDPSPIHVKAWYDPLGKHG